MHPNYIFWFISWIILTLIVIGGIQLLIRNLLKKGLAEKIINCVKFFVIILVLFFIICFILDLENREVYLLFFTINWLFVFGGSVVLSLLSKIIHSKKWLIITIAFVITLVSIAWIGESYIGKDNCHLFAPNPGGSYGKRICVTSPTFIFAVPYLVPFSFFNEYVPSNKVVGNVVIFIISFISNYVVVWLLIKFNRKNKQLVENLYSS
ncbi:MAG: hypothetical protein WC705_01130 [Candidatus Paceibacterota bacterium]|jgi:hypothetical protein